MCIFGLTIYFETPKPQRKGRLSYVICSWLILVLFSLSETADAVLTFNVMANSTSNLDALKRLRPLYEATWWRIGSSICLLPVNWLGDGLLVSPPFWFNSPGA